jgi:hypothetical protein
MMIKTVERSDRKTLMFAATVFAVVILFPVTFPAPSWGGCHCFKDRSFDPLRPASADPYVQATARNSLVASASGMSKGKVVKMRMTGATETDVWLSMYLESPKGIEDAASPAFKAAEKAGDKDAMAAALADRVLARTYRVDGQVLSGLRAAGANTAEVTLSLLVSDRTGKAPRDIFAEVRDGKRSWGKIVSSLGIPLDTTGDLIMEDVRKAVQ